MKLQPIEIPCSEARKKYREYRNYKWDAIAWDARMFGEIRRAYYALSQGKTVVDVNTVIVAAGLNEDKFPKLAICRSNRETCLVNRSAFWGIPPGAHIPHWGVGRRRVPDFQLPRGFLPDGVRGVSQVPLVPPRIRQQLRGGLWNYFTLYEAEWAARPPRDPAILRHLGGPLFELLDVWDLTVVERAVLGRFLK